MSSSIHRLMLELLSQQRTLFLFLVQHRICMSRNPSLWISRKMRLQRSQATICNYQYSLQGFWLEYQDWDQSWLRYFQIRRTKIQSFWSIFLRILKLCSRWRQSLELVQKSRNQALKSTLTKSKHPPHM